MNFRVRQKWPMWLPVLLSVACQGWEPVLVSSGEFEPLLNVVAVLSPDGPEVTVLIQQIMPLEGPSGTGEIRIDTVWFQDWITGDSSYYLQEYEVSRFEVNDAVVSMAWADSSVDFAYAGASSQNPHMSRYRPTGDGFVPRGGVTYQLSIDTPSGLSITGATTVPWAARMISTYTPDTLSVSEPVPLAWEASTGYYQVNLTPDFSREEFRFGCIREVQEVVLNDTTWLGDPLVIPDCPPDPGTFVWYSMSVAALDSNYYHYFLRDPAARNNFTFFLLGEGDEATAYGIEGGMGVFGAYRSDALTRLVIP